MKIVIADAAAGISLFARQRQDPPARAVSDVKVTTFAQHFKRIEKRLTDQGSPDDNRVVLRVTPAATGVIKMVRPGILLELWRLVLDEPLEHAHRSLSIVAVAGKSVHLQVARRHVSSALCRRKRPDAHQGTQVDWALSNGLLQEPLEELDSESQAS